MHSGYVRTTCKEEQQNSYLVKQYSAVQLALVLFQLFGNMAGLEDTCRYHIPSWHCTTWVQSKIDLCVVPVSHASPESQCERRGVIVFCVFAQSTMCVEAIFENQRISRRIVCHVNCPKRMVIWSCPHRILWSCPHRIGMAH